MRILQGAGRDDRPVGQDLNFVAFSVTGKVVLVADLLVIPLMLVFLLKESPDVVVQKTLAAFADLCL